MEELIDKKLVLKEIASFAIGGDQQEEPMANVDHIGMSIEELPTVTEAEIRTKVLEEAMDKVAEEICVDCGCLKNRKCTYEGSNCRVSKIMLEKTMKVLEQLKGE